RSSGVAGRQYTNLRSDDRVKATVPSAVVIRDLRFRYRRRGPYALRLDGLLVFNRPGLTAILCESGWGKTTLLKILTGQLRRYEGSIEVIGVQLESLRSDRLRQSYLRNVGVVPQSLLLFDEWSVERNVDQSLKDAGIKDPVERTGRVQRALR